MYNHLCLPPLKDDKSHDADHYSCQDGAVDGDEFIVQTPVERLVGITVSVGDGGGAADGAVGGVWQEVFLLGGREETREA